MHNRDYFAAPSWAVLDDLKLAEGLVVSIQKICVVVMIVIRWKLLVAYVWLQNVMEMLQFSVKVVQFRLSRQVKFRLLYNKDLSFWYFLSMYCSRQGDEDQVDWRCELSPEDGFSQCLVLCEWGAAFYLQLTLVVLKHRTGIWIEQSAKLATSRAAITGSSQNTGWLAEVRDVFSVNRLAMCWSLSCQLLHRCCCFQSPIHLFHLVLVCSCFAFFTCMCFSPEKRQTLSQTSHV